MAAALDRGAPVSPSPASLDQAATGSHEPDAQLPPSSVRGQPHRPPRRPLADHLIALFLASFRPWHSTRAGRCLKRSKPAPSLDEKARQDGPGPASDRHDHRALEAASSPGRRPMSGITAAMIFVRYRDVRQTARATVMGANTNVRFWATGQCRLRARSHCKNLSGRKC